MRNDGVKTIIVDDESFDLDMIHRAIDWEGLGFHVLATICNAQEALAYLQDNALVDLLISDIQMPVSI